VYLHSREIVHRDLKREKVMLTTDGTVRIGDFGVSTQHEVKDAGQLSTESMLEAAAGTIAYMPQETFIVFLKRSVKRCATRPPADVYAFGVILWRTGRCPQQWTQEV